jgi:hypothetical protein
MDEIVETQLVRQFQRGDHQALGQLEHARQDRV